jgi:hypothetical protein
LKSRQQVSSPAIKASGRLNFDLNCKLFSRDFEVSPNFADRVWVRRRFWLEAARPDSPFEFHIGDEFWQQVLSGVRSPRFPPALKGLSCGGCIIGSSVAIGATGSEDARGLTAMAAEMLAGARAGRNGRHVVAGLFWQSVFGRLGGYVNGAERLRHDAAMRWTRGFHTLGARIS